MKTLRSVLPFTLLAALCVSLSACAEMSHQYANPDAQRDAAAAQRDANAPRQRLTIQSGGGEPLVLPWFIQGAQNWVNH